MTKKVLIKNSRGLNLSAIVETPDKKGIFPAIIFLHGFKGYKEEATYADLAERFLKLDIASIRFDASGFGESEGTIESDYRFSNYINDTEDIYKWLLNQSFIDKNKIGVIGQSMGGAQTILFTSNHPEVKIACAISPPDRIGTDDALGKAKNEWKRTGYLYETSSRYKDKIKIPYQYLEDATKYNFEDLVKKVRVPILVVLGEKDETVLPNQSLAIFDSANEPKFLMRFKDMDHFYKRNEKVLKEVSEKIINFVIKYL